MTELIAYDPWGIGRDQFHVCILLEERERSDGSIHYVQSFRFERDDKPPPTFPFLESQCQRAVSGTNFHHARDATPPARLCPAGGVGAVYRRPIGACQTEKNGKFVFFPRPVDGLGEAGFPGRIRRIPPPQIGSACEIATSVPEPRDFGLSEIPPVPP